METFNEVFLFELDMLAERKHLSVQTVQRQLGLRSHMMSSIRDGLASTSDISYYYEKVLTESLIIDALDRFMVAFDFIMKKHHLRGKLDFAKRMDISMWRLRRVLQGRPNFFNEEFLWDFNKTFGDIFDIEWIMYGEGLMFKDDYHIVKNYGLHSSKEVEEAKRQATIANRKTHDYDRYYDSFRRKLLVKTAMNSDDEKTIFRSIRELSKEIVESKKEIDSYEKRIKDYQQEIRYRNMEIAKLKQKIQNHRNYMVGRAFLEFYDDIERL